MRALLVLLALMVGYELQAATLTVPTSYGTIQAAVDAAHDGDEVVVRPGYYAPSLGYILRAVGPCYLVKTGPDTMTCLVPSAYVRALYKADYSISKRTWLPAKLVMVQRDLNCRWSQAVGALGSHVFLFSCNEPNRFGYLKSTDLTCEHWGGFTAIPHPYDLISAYGQMVAIPGTPVAYVPYYAWSSTGFVLGLIETSDGGVTWRVAREVYHGPKWLTEPVLVYLGYNRMAMFARQYGGGSHSWFRSPDSGKTWEGEFSLEGYVGSNDIIPGAEVAGDILFLTYSERMSPEGRFAVCTGSAIGFYFQGTPALHKPVYTPAANPGYPAMCTLEPRRVFVVYSQVVRSGTSTELYGGDLHFPIDVARWEAPNINIGSKAITLRSIAPKNPAIVQATVLSSAGRDGSVITFNGGPARKATLSGVTICGGRGLYGAGIECQHSSPIISSVIVRDNDATYGGGISVNAGFPLLQNMLVYHNAATYGGGIYSWNGADPAIENATIVDNAASYGSSLFAATYSTQWVRNSIVGGGRAPSAQIETDSTAAVHPSYCDVYNATSPAMASGSGNISVDPEFGQYGGLYRLASATGRWYDARSMWTRDAVSSKCIDAGDAQDDFSGEPMPNGGRVNLGYDGNTPYASKTASVGVGNPALLATATAGANRNGTAALTVSLTAAACIQVTVRNLAGRVVSVLPEQSLLAGMSTLLWNGRSARGTVVPAGTYVLEVLARGTDGHSERIIVPLRK